MTKLDWNRPGWHTRMNDEYWTDPKKGFDKGWHDRLAQKNQGKANRLKKQIDLGEHATHDWQPIKAESGPHAGKLICRTCNNKFLRWLPKDAF